MRGRKLEIIDAQESDTSGYSCQASNIAGLADKDFFLKVLGKTLEDTGTKPSNCRQVSFTIFLTCMQFHQALMTPTS